MHAGNDGRGYGPKQYPVVSTTVSLFTFEHRPCPLESVLQIRRHIPARSVRFERDTRRRRDRLVLPPPAGIARNQNYAVPKRVDQMTMSLPMGLGFGSTIHSFAGMTRGARLDELVVPKVARGAGEFGHGQSGSEQRATWAVDTNETYSLAVERALGNQSDLLRGSRAVCVQHHPRFGRTHGSTRLVTGWAEWAEQGGSNQ